jgi:hypothetical protein
LSWQRKGWKLNFEMRTGMAILPIPKLKKESS